MSKIIRVTQEPVIVWLHDGIKGEYVASQQTGEQELKLRVNGDSGQQGNIIYLPADGERALARSQAKPGDWVKLWKEKNGRNTIWAAEVVSNPAEQAQRPTERTAAPNILNQPGTTNALHYPPHQLARPEANTLLAAYMTALDAQLGLIEYAATKGVPLRFNEITLASSAHCLYIEACKQRADGRHRAA